MFLNSHAETGNDLLDKAIDFHGLELIDAIQRSKTQSFLSTSTFLFAGDPENDLKKKAHHFIARNVKTLFQDKPACSTMTFTKEDYSEDDYFAAMPPIETFMGLGLDAKKDHFRGYLEKGDIIIGRVIKLKPGQGFFISFLCLDCGKKRDLVDLGIRGFCPQNFIPPDKDGGTLEIFADDYIRAVVLSVGESESDVITVSILNSDVPENIKSIVGPIDREDLPAYYRMIGLVPSKNYSTFLHQIATSSNPSCVQNLMNKFGLNDDVPTTFIKSAQSRVIPKNEYAEELRKTQSHRWSLKSVKQGVDQFKKAKFTEAMQHFNRALEIDAQNAEALVARGALFANNNNYPKAIEDFERALEINAHHVNAKNYMCQTLVAHGKNLQENGNYDDAMVQYQKVLKVNPGYKDAENCIRDLEYLQGRKVGSGGEVSSAIDILLSDTKRKAEDMKNKPSTPEKSAPLSPTRKDIFGASTQARPQTPDDFEQAISQEEEYKLADNFIKHNFVYRDYPELKDLNMETMIRVLPRIYASQWANTVEQYKKIRMLEEKAREERRKSGAKTREEERYEERERRRKEEEKAAEEDKRKAEREKEREREKEHERERDRDRDRERERDKERERRDRDRYRMDSIDRELYGDDDREEKKRRESHEERKTVVKAEEELYSGMMDRELSMSIGRRSLTSRDREVSIDKSRDRECRVVSPERRVSVTESRYSSRDDLLRDIVVQSKKEAESRGIKDRDRSRDNRDRDEKRSRRKSTSSSSSRSRSRSRNRKDGRGRSRDRSRGHHKKSRSRSRGRSMTSKEKEAEQKYLEKLRELDASIEQRKKELEELNKEKSNEKDRSRSKDRGSRSSKDAKSSKSRDKKRSRSKSEHREVRVLTPTRLRKRGDSSSSSSSSRSRSRERRKSGHASGGRDRSLSRDRRRSRSRSADRKSSSKSKKTPRGRNSRSRSKDRRSRSRSERRRSRSRSKGRRSRSRSHGRDGRSKSRSKDRRSRSRDRGHDSKRSSDSKKSPRKSSDSGRDVKLLTITTPGVSAIPLPTRTVIPMPGEIPLPTKTITNTAVKPESIPMPEPYSAGATRTMYSDVEETRKVKSDKNDSRSRGDTRNYRDSNRHRSDERSSDRSRDRSRERSRERSRDGRDSRKEKEQEPGKSKWDSPERSSRWDGHSDSKGRKRRFTEESSNKPSPTLPTKHRLDVFGDYPSKSSNPPGPPAKKPTFKSPSNEANGSPAEPKAANKPVGFFVPRQLTKPTPGPPGNKFSFNVKSVKQVQRTKMDDKHLVGKVSVQSAPDVGGPSSQGSDSLAQMESFLANLKKMKGSADLKLAQQSLGADKKS